MSDTIQKIADEVATYQAPPNGQYIQVHPRVMRDWEARLRALSARASAGEGGYDTNAFIRLDFKHADGHDDCKLLTHDEMRQRYADATAAAPQPAQAGASGGGVPPEYTDDARVPDDYCNQPSGYRAGWNDCRDAMLTTPASPATGEEPSAVAVLVAAVNAVLAANPNDDTMWSLEAAVAPFNARKPDECANGCPPQQVCDYCQVVAKYTTPPAHGDGEVVRGEATGDTPTFLETWMKLTTRDRAIISAYFRETTTRPTPEAQEARAEPIKAGILGEGRSNLSFHALRPDGSAACSSYLFVRYEGRLAHEIGRKSRCKSKACQKLFDKADADAALALPAQGEGR